MAYIEDEKLKKQLDLVLRIKNLHSDIETLFYTKREQYGNSYRKSGVVGCVQRLIEKFYRINHNFHNDGLINYITEEYATTQLADDLKDIILLSYLALLELEEVLRQKSFEKDLTEKNE